MFGIDELTAVVAPPVNPGISVTQSDWNVVFERIGTRLPTDFIQAYKLYGDGSFASRTHPMSASVWLHAGRPFSSFERRVPERLSHLRLTKERRPKLVPFPLYWEPNGLLPWARATKDTDLCWRVRGELVDNWTVVVLRAGAGHHESFEMSAIQFLARAIAGTVVCTLLPKGFPGAEGVSFEPLRTSQELSA